MNLHIAVIIAVAVDIVATVSLVVIEVIESRRYKRLIDKISKYKGES